MTARFEAAGSRAPNRKAIQHASRRRLETARLPPLVTGWQIEGRLAIEVIEIGADKRGFLQPDAVVTHEIGTRPDGLTR